MDWLPALASLKEKGIFFYKKRGKSGLQFRNGAGSQGKPQLPGHGPVVAEHNWKYRVIQAEL